MGDTRRAWSVHRGWVSLPQAMFEGADAQQVLRLSHPQVAGVFAHELLHVLQRHQGVPVTRLALGVHCRAWLSSKDAYFYSAPRSPRKLLRLFWSANVEQQGQIWQDCVEAEVAGQARASHAWLTRVVHVGMLRRGRRHTGDVKQ